MADEHYDLIVIGFGGVGSAALYHASKKGWRALGLDQFGPAHNKGSSHGQTRIIRKAYFEHPNYVPLAKEAFERWDELNNRHRTRPEIMPLFEQTGVLQIGQPGSEVIRGVQQSSAQHGLKLETFTPDQIHQRLPILNIDPDHVGLFEPEAGILRVEHCVAAHIAQAIKRGAKILADCKVHHWSADNSGIVVDSGKGTFRADRLAICAGAWSEQFLSRIDVALRVVPRQQNWYQIDRVEQKRVNDFPVVFIEENDGEQFYCLPELDSHGMKVCHHSGGSPIDGADRLNREHDASDSQLAEAFLDRNFHHSRHRLVHHAMCMYTMSPDGHFIVDTHPEHANVAFAAGLSGHGFKFAPVLGHRLVEMLDGNSDPNLAFLSAKRFSQAT